MGRRCCRPMPWYRIRLSPRRFTPICAKCCCPFALRIDCSSAAVALDCDGSRPIESSSSVYCLFDGLNVNRRRQRSEVNGTPSPLRSSRYTNIAAQLLSENAPCQTSPVMRDSAPADLNADPVGPAAWYMNPDRTIWAGPVPEGGWPSGGRLFSGNGVVKGQKTYWVRPAGKQLGLTGRRMDAKAGLRLRRRSLAATQPGSRSSRYISRRRAAGKCPPALESTTCTL